MPLLPLNDKEEITGMYSQLNNTVFRILVGVVFAGFTAWGAYINSRVNEVDTIKNDIIWIKEALKDIQEQQRIQTNYLNRQYIINQSIEEKNAQRHNP